MKRGFSIVEVVLAAALFAIFATAAVVSVVSGLSGDRVATEQTVATQYASEGIEAMRSIKNQAFANLVDTVPPTFPSSTTGVKIAGGVWTYSGTANNTLPSDSRFTRTIKVETACRDSAVLPTGNIVACPGAASDPNTKRITVTVSWPFTSVRTLSVVQVTYLTNWKAPVVAVQKGGMLVYGDGGTTTDAIKFKTLSGSSGLWSAAAATSSGATTNRALRAVKLYASSTRNEKVMISRHYNGSAQFIFAQVYNGTSWGNTVQLSTWTATTFLDVQNFDGSYLANGNFMVVYSDNTRIPKSMVWNGTAWSAQTSLTSLGTSQIPAYIEVAARPGTNEVMAAFFTQASATITQYYNGTAWSVITSHATAAPATTKRFIDFTWSPNDSTIGALVFSDSTTDKTVNVRTCVASGGSCVWGTAGASAAQTNNLGALAIAGRIGANEFLACNKDSGAIPIVICYKVTHAATPTFSVATTIAGASDTGLERSYHMGFEQVTGDPGLGVFSDNTAVPKYKKYVSATGLWDGTATSISTSPYTLGTVTTVRLIPQTGTNDIMILLGDSNLDFYSVIWDGTNNLLYTTPAGKAFSQHGISGSAATEFWYDFAWDLF